MIQRPNANEYVPYYDLYISKVPEGDVLELMEGNIAKTRELIAGVDEEKANYRYAPDKWSIKQLVGHLTDIERLFGYRALAFARNDKSPLPAIEQDDYVTHANFDDRPLQDIADEFELVRKSVLAMFRGFDDEIFMRRGTASGFEFTVRAIPFILAGHEIHHIGVLKERYL